MSAKRLWALAALTLLVALLAPASAVAGGFPTVRPPADLRADDCEPGAPVDVAGAGKDIRALGCVGLRSRGPTFLVAGVREGGVLCMFAVPEGGRGYTQCASIGRLERGRVDALGIDLIEPGGVPFAWGTAAPQARRIQIAGSSGTRDLGRRASILRVGAVAAASVGVREPFAVHVGLVPGGADTCQGLAAVALSPPAYAGAARFERFAATIREIAMPGDRACSWLARIARVLAGS